MFKFVVFEKTKKGKKKVGYHKYPTFEAAEDARYAISHMPKKEYTYIPREGAKQVTRILGGYTCGNITEE